MAIPSRSRGERREAILLRVRDFGGIVESESEECDGAKTW